MRKLLLIVIFLFAAIIVKAQSFEFRMGLGTGIDMGIRLDKTIPERYTTDYQNAATPTVDVFAKFSYKRFNFIPDVKVSYATFGKGRRKAINANGFSIPEGEYISLVHDGNFYETIERSSYLLDKTDITVTNLFAGAFVTYRLFPAKLGYLEVGTGAFYFRKQLNLKEYMAHDAYEYYGSSGSHELQLQTDEYYYSETLRDKKPFYIERVKQHLIAIPVIVQYNFRAGDYVQLSPSFTAYFGMDPVYNLNLAISFGNSK